MTMSLLFVCFFVRTNTLATFSLLRIVVDGCRGEPCAAGLAPAATHHAHRIDDRAFLPHNRNGAAYTSVCCAERPLCDNENSDCKVVVVACCVCMHLILIVVSPVCVARQTSLCSLSMHNALIHWLACHLSYCYALLCAVPVPGARCWCPAGSSATSSEKVFLLQAPQQCVGVRVCVLPASPSLSEAASQIHLMGKDTAACGINECRTAGLWCMIIIITIVCVALRVCLSSVLCLCVDNDTAKN
jgi:hypothetical protein